MEQRPGRVESSYVFPVDKDHFTSSEAIIISGVHKGKTELAKVKWIHTGMMTAVKRNHWLIVSVSTRISPLLINLVLAGKILVIALAVSHWFETDVGPSCVCVMCWS